jgi:hypothetical protein
MTFANQIIDRHKALGELLKLVELYQESCADVDRAADRARVHVELLKFDLSRIHDGMLSNRDRDAFLAALDEAKPYSCWCGARFGSRKESVEHIENCPLPASTIPQLPMEKK